MIVLQVCLAISMFALGKHTTAAPMPAPAVMPVEQSESIKKSEELVVLARAFLAAGIIYTKPEPHDCRPVFAPLTQYQRVSDKERFGTTWTAMAKAVMASDTKDELCMRLALDRLVPYREWYPEGMKEIDSDLLKQMDTKREGIYATQWKAAYPDLQYKGGH
jgi:hypothetical protein